MVHKKETVPKSSMATPVALATYSDLQATVPVMGNYYLEWTGNEAIQWAAYFCQKALTPDMRLVHYDASDRSQWIDPSRRLIDQGVRPGDRIALYSAPPAQTQTQNQAACQPQLQPSQSPAEEKSSRGSTFLLKSQNADRETASAPACKDNLEPKSSTPANPVMQISPEKLDSLIVKISDFEKIERIEAGPDGTTYRARDRKTGKEYALKSVLIDFDNPDQGKWFLREVKILASLNHPCLLRLYGFVPYEKRGDDGAAIITEYMKGGSLQDVNDRQAKGLSPPGWDDTHKLIALYGVAVGMCVLHSGNIIHRDLNPNHILLNENFEPKVAGFCLSKFVEGDPMHQSMQGGTPVYMAPEIHEGTSYDYSVDVYAYGMLAYCTLTGLMPFSKCRNPMLLIAQVCSGDRPPIPDYISEPWRALIEACWDHTPSKRPSFQHIVTELASAKFVTDSVDLDIFRRYQEKVRIPGGVTR